jgi:hypothetical protein
MVVEQPNFRVPRFAYRAASGAIAKPSPVLILIHTCKLF